MSYKHVNTSSKVCFPVFPEQNKLCQEEKSTACERMPVQFFSRKESVEAICYIFL